MERFSLQTQKRDQIIDITPEVNTIVKKSGIQSGIALVYSPHTTAAISVNENYDPDVKSDMLRFLKSSIPQDNGFDHAEGNSDSHIKAGLFNFSQGFIVQDSTIQLGQWQGIYFMEFDGPRNRNVWVQIISS